MTSNKNKIKTEIIAATVVVSFFADSGNKTDRLSINDFYNYLIY